ncbi:MAG: tetratricopeptide repeat protein [Chloroflexota bacterium]
MAKDNMYIEAMEAAKQGKRAKAREMLTRLLRTNKHNVDYWLGLSSVVDSQKEQIYCLEKALEVDPNNDIALRGMILFGVREPNENLEPIKPERKREFDIGKIGKASDLDGKKKIANIPVGRLATLGVVTVVAIGLLYVGVTNFTNIGPNSNPGARDNILAAGTAGPTPTFIGDGPGDITPLAEINGPTPLSLLLERPYTATPRYVSTPHGNTGAYRSAMIAFDAGNWEQAVEFLEQAMESEPGAADLRYHLGIAYLNLEEYFDAKKAFLQAANLDSNFGPAYLGLALADIGIGLEGELVSELNSAIQHDPDMGVAYVERAIFKERRGNVDGALADLGRAEERSLNSALLYLTFTKIYLAEERYDDALAAALHSYEIDITIVETYWLLAQAYYKIGETREAISPLQTYLQFEDENAKAWLLLGELYVTEGLYDNGLAALEKSLELDDSLGEANYFRGLAYLLLEDYENALKYLGNASNNFPSWFEPNIMYGRALLESGDEAEGYRMINRSSAFAKTPQQLVVLNYWLAISLEAVNEEETALRYWEALLTLSTDIVPREWESLARSRLTNAGIALPARTPPAPTSTRMPSPTPSVTPTPTP